MEQQEDEEQRVGMCSRCGRVVEHVLPCAPPGYLIPTTWLCVACVGLVSGVEVVPVSYMHMRFAPGEWVYIDPAIRVIHPQHYCADQIVQVCEGSYYPYLEALGERSHATLVPVLWAAAGGGICFVEEEYVSVSIGNEMGEGK